MGETGKRSRRARISAVATAVAISAPVLFLGGTIARAAESSSGGPTSVSVTYTDGSGQAVGNDGRPVPTTGVSESSSSSAPWSSDQSSSAQQEVSLPVNGASGADGNTGTTGSDGYGSSSVQQILSLTIRPGPLTITPSSESISFTQGRGRGEGESLAGSLSTVTVVDARGSLVGWRATVSLQSVAGLSAADLAKATLCLTPAERTVIAGNPPEVKSAHHSCGGVGAPLTLFYAPPNGGGGTFTDTGSLTLSLPGVTGASAASATLAVAVH